MGHIMRFVMGWSVLCAAAISQLLSIGVAPAPDITRKEAISGDNQFGSVGSSTLKFRGFSRDSTCPSSASFVHASCKFNAQVAVACADVHDEIVARINGVNGWYDPHNKGKYNLLEESESVIHASRNSAEGGYTDKMDFTLQPAGDASCLITACSVSQST